MWRAGAGWGRGITRRCKTFRRPPVRGGCLGLAMMEEVSTKAAFLCAISRETCRKMKAPKVSKCVPQEQSQKALLTGPRPRMRNPAVLRSSKPSFYCRFHGRPTINHDLERLHGQSGMGAKTIEVTGPIFCHPGYDEFSKPTEARSTRLILGRRPDSQLAGVRPVHGRSADECAAPVRRDRSKLANRSRRRRHMCRASYRFPKVTAKEEGRHGATAKRTDGGGCQTQARRSAQKAPCGRGTYWAATNTKQIFAGGMRHALRMQLLHVKPGWMPAALCRWTILDVVARIDLSQMMNKGGVVAGRRAVRLTMAMASPKGTLNGSPGLLYRSDVLECDPKTISIWTSSVSVQVESPSPDRLINPNSHAENRHAIRSTDDAHALQAMPARRGHLALASHPPPPLAMSTKRAKRAQLAFYASSSAPSEITVCKRRHARVPADNRSGRSAERTQEACSHPLPAGSRWDCQINNILVKRATNSWC